MEFRALALGLFLIPAGCTAAAGQTLPTLGVDGSLSASFADNSFQQADRRSDFLTSPYLRFSADGKLIIPDLSYSLYASGGFDKYATRGDADSTYAALGAGLTQRWGRFQLGVAFERSHAYDGIFGTYLYVANNVSGYVSYSYLDVPSGIRIRPAASISHRSADDPSARRNVYAFKVDIERKLADRWFAVVTPRLRFYHFTGGENAGRYDTLYSISGGVRYAVNDDINLSAVVGYERRNSTVQSRGFDNLGAGVSLDFSLIFDPFKR